MRLVKKVAIVTGSVLVVDGGITAGNLAFFV